MDQFNLWTGALWQDDPEFTLRAFWQQPLLGAGTSFPTAILYLRSRQQPAPFHIWMPTLEQGLAFLGQVPRGADQAEKYLHYTRLVEGFRTRLGLKLPEVDIVLTRLAGLVKGWADELKQALTDLGVDFPAGNLVKKFKPEYGLSFDISVSTSAIPGMWLAGSRRRQDGAAGETYLPPEFLQEVLDLAEERRQVILYGPPGTGKTYVARRLGRVLTGGDETRIEVVQFHPSYSYEEFMEGLRQLRVASSLICRSNWARVLWKGRCARRVRALR